MHHARTGGDPRARHLGAGARHEGGPARGDPDRRRHRPHGGAELRSCPSAGDPGPHARARAARMGDRRRPPAHRRRRHLHARSSRSSATACPAWRSRRARSARRRSATAGPSAATSAPPRPPATRLPPLYASDAEVELVSVTGTRLVIPSTDFVTGPKRNVRARGRADRRRSTSRPRPARSSSRRSARATRWSSPCARSRWRSGPSAARSCACIGSAGPTPIRAAEAEAFIAGVLDDEGLWDERGALSDDAVERFGELVAAAASPIDDVRGSAAYRRHALGVLARRTLTWAWEEQRCA